MKYASQKRILIEIALIKLCRPIMEQDYDSLLERVRTIEKQLENGIALSPIGEQGRVVETTGGTVSGQPTQQNRPPLPKAIPEDVQMAVGAWQNIVAQTSMPMKQYLKDARLSLGGDNRLVVVVEDGLASDYFLKQEGHKEILEQLLSEAVGKEIDVAIQSVQGQEAFAQNYVDLSQLVHMDIDIEDEE
jgi:DNA polymerase-3 subunit gamma/tau